MSIRDHLTHDLRQRPHGVYCATCDLSIPDPQVSMPETMPVYTDPADMARLRPVTSVRGWQPDRDDPDAASLRRLYVDMDRYVNAFNASTEVEEAQGHAVDMAYTWCEIRRLMKGE